MSTKETQFKKNKITVGDLVEALKKFDPTTEVTIMNGKIIYNLVEVSDNTKWGNDNEMAILEINRNGVGYGYGKL